jgi:hypothetical protein
MISKMTYGEDETGQKKRKYFLKHKFCSGVVFNGCFRKGIKQ